VLCLKHWTDGTQNKFVPLTEQVWTIPPCVNW
jgi:hypothetical protein